MAKVNHYGTAFSSNQAFVTALSAEVAVISVGKNGVGRPDPAVVARWGLLGAVYVTQSADDNAFIDGDVTIVAVGITGMTATAATSGMEVDSCPKEGRTSPMPRRTTSCLRA